MDMKMEIQMGLIESATDILKNWIGLVGITEANYPLLWNSIFLSLRYYCTTIESEVSLVDKELEEFLHEFLLNHIFWPHVGEVEDGNDEGAVYRTIVLEVQLADLIDEFELDGLCDKMHLNLFGLNLEAVNKITRDRCEWYDTSDECIEEEYGVVRSFREYPELTIKRAQQVRKEFLDLVEVQPDHPLWAYLWRSSKLTGGARLSGGHSLMDACCQ